jgi:hypothetical protein
MSPNVVPRSALCGLAPADFHNGGCMVVARHGGCRSRRLADGSNLLVCSSLPAYVPARAYAASQRHRLLDRIDLRLRTHIGFVFDNELDTRAFRHSVMTKASSRWPGADSFGHDLREIAEWCRQHDLHLKLKGKEYL